MFLKQLTLENIRCFKRLSLDFERPQSAQGGRGRGRGRGNRKWTIILGENGAGKSTILRSAALITAGSRGLSELLGEPGDWLRLRAEQGAIGAVIENQAGEVRELRLEFRRGDQVHDVIRRAEPTLAPLDEALAYTERNYFVAAYGSSRRLSTKSTLGATKSSYRSLRAQSVATLFDRDSSLHPIESWAMQLDYERGIDGLTTVAKALNAFMRGVNFERIDKRSGQLFFKTPDGSVPLGALSDGYQNVAAWVGDLLYRIHQAFEDYNEPLKTRGLLIIDEIDLHLHPRWQRRLYQYLQRKLPEMQLLVTSHSAVTAQQAESNELFYLKRTGKQVDLHPFEADPSSLLIGQLLLTEAFGLDSDESKRLEQTRDRYRSLRDKPEHTARESREYEQLKESLGAHLEQRAATHSRIPDTELERLRAVQAKLLKKSR